MKKIFLFCLSVTLVVLTINFIGSTVAQAGTKNMSAGKRVTFKDDSVESMRDVFARRETEDKEYKEKMLANSDATIELLTEVRDLLQQLNEKE